MPLQGTSRSALSKPRGAGRVGPQALAAHQGCAGEGYRCEVGAEGPPNPILKALSGPFQVRSLVRGSPLTPGCPQAVPQPTRLVLVKLVSKQQQKLRFVIGNLVFGLDASRGPILGQVCGSPSWGGSGQKGRTQVQCTSIWKLRCHS